MRSGRTFVRYDSFACVCLNSVLSCHCWRGWPINWQIELILMVFNIQALTVRQIYRISTMYWDDKYGTQSVSNEACFLFHKSLSMGLFLCFFFFKSSNIILLRAGGCPDEGAFEQGQPESYLQFILIGWWSKVICLALDIQSCSKQNHACMVLNRMAELEP